MILIADSGSTKTDWRLFEKSKNKVYSFSSIGLNPYFVSAKEIAMVCRRVIPAEMIDKINSVHFYGSGCGSSKPNKSVYNGLNNIFNNATLKVYSDLMGASRALFSTSSGVACILGTGSNACYFSQGEIKKKATSLGFILGDEGSGSHLGKLLIKSIYSKKAPKEIAHSFEEEFPHIDLQFVLENLYKSSAPNKFLAGFSPFIYKHRNNEFIRSKIEFSFNEFLDELVLKLLSKDSDVVGFQGSIAYYFQKEISAVCKNKGLNSILFLKDPVDKLLEYHQKDILN
jgi:glucosamine kinase